MNPNSPDFQYNQEIMKVVGALSKITSRSPEEIKPHLDKLLSSLAVESNGNINLDSASLFSETSTHEEWSAEFHQWIDSHKGRNIPVLSEEAMSRESMYPDRW